MEPIAQRLKSFLQHKELNTTAFCRILQYRSCEKIARLFRLKNAKPSVDILEDIAHHFTDLNMRWLITGEGEMLAGPAALPAVTEKNDARLLVLHTKDNDQYILHQPGPAFVFQRNGAELVRATPGHSEQEMEKALGQGTLINFIENMRDEN